MKLFKSLRSTILISVFVLIASMASATPYAKVELDYFDQYNADMRITLWSDFQCTIPYTPPSGTPLYVEVTNDWALYTDIDFNWQTPIVEGFFLTSHDTHVKQVNILRWYPFLHPEYGEMTQWVWSNYSVTADGSGNYIPFSTGA